MLVSETMRRVDEDFDQDGLVLVYIAKRLRDAKKIEESLTSASVDYLVEADTYRGGIIFQSERVGAFFYVTEQDEARARALLVEWGFAPYQPASDK